MSILMNKRNRIISDQKHNSVSVKRGIMYVFIANAINLAISLFTAFFLPKFLSVDSYANIKLFNLYITYLGILHLGYADGMYLRNGGKSIYSINGKEAKVEFNTFKLFQVIMCLLMVGVSLAINNQVLLLCSLVILPVNVSSYVRNLYNAIGEFKKYSRFTNINTLMIFVINVILLFIIKTDYYLYYIVAYVVTYFAYWMFIEYELRKVLGRQKSAFRFERRYIKENVGTGVFLMTGNFCNVIFTSIDRLFVKNLIGMVEFAYYSFAVSIENLLNVFINPISITMYNYFCRGRSYERVIKIKRYSLLLASIIISFAFLARFVIESWLPKYLSSIGVLFFLIAAQYAAMLIRIVHVNLYKSKKQQKKYFGIMVCVIAVSLLLNMTGYLIFKNTISIAVATLLTNTIWFIVGEIDLREYALHFKDYLFFCLNMVVFIICGLNMGAIHGFIVYSVLAVMWALIFEFKTCKSLFLETKRIIKKRIKKNNKNI